jgi:hypothetical protein
LQKDCFLVFCGGGGGGDDDDDDDDIIIAFCMLE